MTLKIEKPSFPDRVLAVLGKRRAVYIPSGMQPFGYYETRRESFVRALLRPRGAVLPNGWVYWDENEMYSEPNLDKTAQRIGNFFVSRKTELFDHLTKTEPKLLETLLFEKSLGLACDTSSGVALFGWGSLKADFVLPDAGNAIMEVKYIRTRPYGEPNECDIKNAMAQVVEQAVCKKATNAFLVLIDAGDARNRDWNDQERKFVGMFKSNPFKICLRIVRIRVVKEQDSVFWSSE